MKVLFKMERVKAYSVGTRSLADREAFKRTVCVCVCVCAGFYACGCV